MKRREVLGQFLGAAVSAGFASSSWAQDYPSRPIRIVVPYAAGGSPDTVSRIVAQPLSQILGVPVVIDNQPGSGGIGAIEFVKRAAPDGYTLMDADAGHWAVNRLIKKQLPYEFQRDLEPVAMMSTSSLFLAVHESVPAKTLQELVAVVKANPGKYTYGSSGVGSLHHLTMEAFKAGLGLDILHVPYKGTGQSVPALAAGQVSMAIAAYNSVAPFAKAGKLRILAANTRERAGILPQFPPMGDAGLKDFQFPGENALFAPAGTPRPVVEKVVAGLQRVLKQPDTIAKLNGAGVEPPPTVTSAALSETIRRDIPRYEAAVRAAGIQPD